MKILLIGCGNRAKAYALYLKKEIAFVCDPREGQPDLLIKEYGLVNAAVCSDYKTCGVVDAIIIAVPDYLHEEVFEWAIKQCVPILLEKPVAVKSKSLRNMYNTGKCYKKGIILGFTLRYTFMYRKILELLSDNAIGEIVTVEAAEVLDPIHAAKFFRRWHRFSKFSGGFLNTKCSHDMDMINQIVPGKPRKIASFGRNSIFKPGKGAKNCTLDCPEFNNCRFIDTNEYKFSTADTSICPYNIESDIVDHQVVAMEYDSGVTVVFTVSMHSDKGDRHIFIHGTTGSIRASFDDQIVYLCKTGQPDEAFKPTDTGGSHGGGDRSLCDNFTECIVNNVGENHLIDGITASAMALAADEARKTGQVIDMEIFADYMFGKK